MLAACRLRPPLEAARKGGFSLLRDVPSRQAIQFAAARRRSSKEFTSLRFSGKRRKNDPHRKPRPAEIVRIDRAMVQRDRARGDRKPQPLPALRAIT
jgi:hypothetical protein